MPAHYSRRFPSDLDRAMRVDREFRGAGPNAQDTQPNDVAFE